MAQVFAEAVGLICFNWMLSWLQGSNNELTT